MDQEFMLTTTDNPYNPFEQFASWYLFDVEKGYNTYSRIARIANISDGLSDVEIKNRTEEAIDDLLELDFMKIYKKVSKNKSE